MADPNATPPSSPRWIRLVLIASIALNLLVLGIVGGAILSPDGPRAQRAEANERIASVPFLRALDSKERRDLIRSIRNQPAPMRATDGGPRQATEAILVLIRSDPFDATALSEALESQRRMGQERQLRGERALIQTLSEMSPEERGAYADRLEEAIAKRPSKKH